MLRFSSSPLEGEGLRGVLEEGVGPQEGREEGEEGEVPREDLEEEEEEVVGLPCPLVEVGVGEGLQGVLEEEEHPILWAGL